MANPFFTFKKFTVRHDRCAMKVGTDGVLLGAWADVSNSRQVLDIGTGTGLIALMLAQRSHKAQITAVDIDFNAVLQASENILASPWRHRIEVFQKDICTYTENTLFDTIVSNPPYFSNSLKCTDVQRNTARHTDTLTASSLLSKVAELLTSEGCFSVIIPSEQTDDFINLSAVQGLYPSRLTQVITRPGLPPKRSLLEFRKKDQDCLVDELVVELERHVYSEDYITLTKDFYLKM